jgi:hypothetical protein
MVKCIIAVCLVGEKNPSNVCVDKILIFGKLNINRDAVAEKSKLSGRSEMLLFIVGLVCGILVAMPICIYLLNVLFVRYWRPF